MTPHVIHEYVCLACGFNFDLDSDDPLEYAFCSACGSTEIVSRY